MYSYHNRIKQRINAGELTGCEFVKDYPNIGECLLLFFNKVPFVRPIRPHAYYKYIDVINLQENDGKE
jgi:hypothetical protein